MFDTDKEFLETFGKIIATQDETNLCNDDDANERIYIVEYLPDETKYALLFDVGNGEWTLLELVNKSDVVVDQALVELHDKQRLEVYRQWGAKI